MAGLFQFSVAGKNAYLRMASTITAKPPAFFFLSLPAQNVDRIGIEVPIVSIAVEIVFQFTRLDRPPRLAVGPHRKTQPQPRQAPRKQRQP